MIYFSEDKKNPKMIHWIISYKNLWWIQLSWAKHLDRERRKQLSFNKAQVQCKPSENTGMAEAFIILPCASLDPKRIVLVRAVEVSEL